MLIFPYLTSFDLLLWTAISIFQEFLSSLIFIIFDYVRGTTGCYDYYLLTLFAVLRSSNRAQNTTVLCAGSQRVRLTANYQTARKVTFTTLLK